MPDFGRPLCGRREPRGPSNPPFDREEGVIEMSRGAKWVAMAALVLAVLAQQAWCAVATDYWVESHAVKQGIVTGDRWDGTNDPADYPAVSVWDGVAFGRAEFGAHHTYSASSLAEGTYFAYSYADATWSDRITVYVPGVEIGEGLEMYLHFDLSGGLSIAETGVLPDDTVREGRAAVSADVVSYALGVNAHGYNMLSDKTGAGVIVRQSGGWDLGGTSTTPVDYTYDNALVIPVLMPNGVEVDLWAQVAAASSVKLDYVGDGEFGGLGTYGMSAEADFSHTMVLGGLTDATGMDITELGYLVGSQGPTFGGPLVIPEPATVVLVFTSMTVFALRRARRKA